MVAAGGREMPGEWNAEPASAETEFSDHVRQALLAAEHVARNRKAPDVAPEDLLEGILSVTDCSIVEALRALMPSPPPVEPPPDRPIHERAWATSDDPTGAANDLLKIASEVDALCEVITAKDVFPPISIGLFGDWGTGKTFFMKKMQKRVREIAREAGKHPADTAFHADICQIEFNSWHYIDTNLWASLTSEIFEQLARQLRSEEDKDDPAKTRARLLNAVLRSEDALADAERMRDEANRAVTEGLASLDRIAESDREIEAELSAGRLVQSVLAEIQDSEEWKRQRKKIAEALHLREVEAATTEVQAHLLEVRGHWSWLKGIWVSLRSRKAAWNWTFGVLLAGGVLTTAAIFIRNTSLDRVEELATTVAAFFTGAVGLVSPFLKRAAAVVGGVRSFYEKEENNLERAKAERKAELEQRRKELREVQAQEQARVAKAREVLEGLRRELDALRADRRLADFVAERRASADYSRHLGVIARARKDFERLSALLEEARTEPARTGDQPIVPRVDRIILYIDDLDRCPESKVVDVLQAVHLLLAFPLFVVVVGVDPRWLLHSLRQHSEAFRSDDEGDAPMSEEERTHWQSTPLNYLEKIFQIPFALRPMGPKGFGRLVDDLSVPKKEAPPPPEVSAPPPATGKRETVGKPESKEAKQPTEASAADRTPRDRADGIPAGAGAAAEADAREEAPERPVDANPQHLTISEHERDAMKLLHEFVPTARATKRFVNIYRMLRNAVPTAERTAFVGDETWGEHRIVLVLLALLVGYPEEATVVLRTLLEKEPDLGKGRKKRWWTFLDGIVRDGIGEASTGGGNGEESAPDEPATAAGPSAERWRQIQRKLGDKKVRELIPVTSVAADSVRWARRVARYSFQSSRVLVAGRLEEEEPADEA